MLALSTGLAAGALHVVAGPDHLAALAPIAVDDRHRATQLGALWGLGHGTGVVALGVLGMGGRHLVDIEAVSVWSEFAVGWLIIAIGVWSLKQASGIVIHDHGHDHGVRDHSHAHMHVGGDTAHQAHAHSVFAVGMFHGAAGSGHLFGVLPSLALPPAQAAVYLGAYLCSAVATMGGFGWVLGHIGRRSGPSTIRGLLVASGVAAIAVGVFWVATGVPALS